MKRPGRWLASVSTLDAQADPELERLFAAARTAVDPSPENRARVTSAVASAVSRSAPPGAGAGGTAGEPAIDALRRAATARTVGGVSGKWLAAGGALTLALGFWLGQTVGRAEGRLGAAPSPQLAVSDPAVRDPAVRDPAVRDPAVRNPAMPDPAVHDRARDPGAPGPSAALAARDGVLPDDDAVESSSPRVPDGKAPAAFSANGPRARASSPRAARRGRAAIATAAPATLSFREVLEQLRRARAQLDAGQATASLLVLSELDRNAGDLLLEERETTRVLALCAADQDKAARAVADRLRASSPRSIYAMRIESSCAAESTSDARATHE